MSLSPEFVALLRCPRSGEPLVHVPARGEEPECLVCPMALLKYRVDDGVPVLLVAEAEALSEATLAELLSAR
jgi:uncharacterized protein YbaR (Trm112 family)